MKTSKAFKDEQELSNENRERFMPVPENLIRDYGLTHAKALTLTYLKLCQGSKGYAYPSHSTIAEKLRLSKRQVINILSDLDSDGFIDREPGGGRDHPTHYQVLKPNPWLNPDTYKKVKSASLSDTRNGEMGFTLKESKRGLKEKSVKRGGRQTSFQTHKTKKTHSQNQNPSASLSPTKAERGFDFGKDCSPYKERRDLDTAVAPHEESQIEEWFREDERDHWHDPTNKIGGGMRRWYFRAARSGSLEKYGRVFLSLGEVEEAQREQAKVDAKRKREGEEDIKRKAKEQAEREKWEPMLRLESCQTWLKLENVKGEEKAIEFLKNITPQPKDLKAWGALCTKEISRPRWRGRATP